MKTIITLAILLINVSAFGAPATQPAVVTKPVEPFDGITPILRQIPVSTFPADGKKWTRLKADSANSIVTKDIGKPASVVCKVSEVGHGYDRPRADDWKECRGEYWVNIDPAKMNTWAISLKCYFGDDQKEKLANLNAGDTVAVKGNIVRCEFHQYPSGWAFCVDLGRCHVMD